MRWEGCARCRGLVNVCESRLGSQLGKVTSTSGEGTQVWDGLAGLGDCSKFCMVGVRSTEKECHPEVLKLKAREHRAEAFDPRLLVALGHRKVVSRGKTLRLTRLRVSLFSSVRVFNLPPPTWL